MSMEPSKVLSQVLHLEEGHQARRLMYAFVLSHPVTAVKLRALASLGYRSAGTEHRDSRQQS